MNVGLEGAECITLLTSATLQPHSQGPLQTHNDVTACQQLGIRNPSQASWGRQHEAKATWQRGCYVFALALYQFFRLTKAIPVDL